MAVELLVPRGHLYVPRPRPVRPRDGHTFATPALLAHALIPLDGSTLSEAAIAPALWLLGAHGTITLLRAVGPITVELAPTMVPLAASDPQLLNEEVGAARDQLECIATMLRARGYTVHVEVVVHPAPAAAIADAVRVRQPHFVSMATHGRTGIARMFMGSVAETVLRHADVPVLLFKPPLG